MLLLAEKQPLEVLCKKSCSQKFRKIHRKTPVPESLFYWSLQKNTIFTEHFQMFSRSSRSSQMFFKIGVLKNFTIFKGKHLFWILKYRPSTLLKRDSKTGVFLWILRNLRTAFFIEHLRRLLLKWNSPIYSSQYFNIYWLSTVKPTNSGHLKISNMQWIADKTLSPKCDNLF